MKNIPLIDNDYLRELALDYVNDLITIEFEPENIEKSFGKAAKSNGLTMSQMKEYGLFWERDSEIENTLEDGTLIFKSYNLMHKEDLPQFQKYVEYWRDTAKQLQSIPYEERVNVMQQMLDNISDENPPGKFI